ncbi:MAG TPA: toprim domain-containing protein, partial [Phaeodactylibacter sp.]|nr:toprim domain-containing protein [Phaeodactylibacter sp.]
DVYNKRKVLYGAYFAKQAIRKHDECIMVEGYTDVISLHQAGIENVVASSGTSLTVEQIQLVKRNTENIKILYDGDIAGVKAALRGMGLVLEQGMNVKIVLLPEGEDPDSYLQSVGTDAFNTYITKQAQDFLMFQANLLKAEADGDPIKQSKLIQELVASIARIPDPIKRSLYIRECAKIMEVEEQLLVNEANKAVGQHIKQRSKEREREQRRREREAGQTGGSEEPPFPTEEPPLGHERYIPEDAPMPGHPPAASDKGDGFQERDIVRILINGGGVVFDKEEGITVADYILSNVEDVLEDFDNKLYQKVIRLVAEHLAGGQELSPSFFLHHPDSEVQQLAVDLSSTPYEYSENWAKRWDIFLTTQKMPEENFVKDSSSAMKRFRLRKLNRMIEENAEKIKALYKAGSEEYMLHLKLDQRLKAMRNELAAELGTVVF